MAVALGALLLVEIGLALTSGAFGTGLAPGLASYPPPAVTWGDNVRAIGQLMFTQDLLPFELTSILLLIALVGATALAKGRLRGGEKPE